MSDEDEIINHLIKELQKDGCLLEDWEVDIHKKAMKQAGTFKNMSIVEYREIKNPLIETVKIAILEEIITEIKSTEEFREEEAREKENYKNFGHLLDAGSFKNLPGGLRNKKIKRNK